MAFTAVVLWAVLRLRWCFSGDTVAVVFLSSGGLAVTF